MFVHVLGEKQWGTKPQLYHSILSLNEKKIKQLQFWKYGRTTDRCGQIDHVHKQKIKHYLRIPGYPILTQLNNHGDFPLNFSSTTHLLEDLATMESNIFNTRIVRDTVLVWGCRKPKQKVTHKFLIKSQ